MERHILGQPLLLLLNMVITYTFLGFAGLALRNSSIESAFVLFCLLLFAFGALTLLAALLKAISRSRFAEVSLPGVFFLGDGSTASRVRNWFIGLLVIQVLSGFAIALAAPFSATVFAILVPQVGFGLMALQGAFLGRFDVK